MIEEVRAVLDSIEEALKKTSIKIAKPNWKNKKGEYLKRRGIKRETVDAFVDERYPGLAINKGELEPEYFNARRGGKRKQEWKITHVKSGYGILTLKSKKEAENKLIAIG